MTIQLIPRHLWGKGAFCVCQSPCRAWGRAAPLGNALDGFARGEHHPFPSALQTNAIPSPEPLSWQTHTEDPLKEAIPASKLPQTQLSASKVGKINKIISC